LIFYMTIDGGIDVIRILHAARDSRAVLDEGE
jgi:plasmid stabilization system protein ParE